MTNKQILQLKNKDDEEIIRIMPSQVSYVDEFFWKEKFKEKHENCHGKIEDEKFVTKCFR